jgi:hypothetical protein
MPISSSFFRFALNELTYERISDGVSRRLADIPHALAWNFAQRYAISNRDHLFAMADIHAGQRCFILGNGPSLARMDLSLLKNDICFGLNRIYLIFEQTDFRPTYYVCVNEPVLEQFSSEIAALPMPKFLNWNRRKLFDRSNPSINFVRLSLALQDGFGRRLDASLYSGGTVTYVSLQIAFAMGFTTVILVGLDHSFVDKGTPNKLEVRREEFDLNHFSPDYFPKGVKWQIPDLRRSEKAYSLARSVFEGANRQILDATVQGNCQVFKKVDFRSLF